MTEQELIDNYNRLLKENDELKEEINILKAIECPLEKDFLGYMNCEYPKQGPTMPCHNRIREMIEEHNNQIKAYKEILETRREHEARADERFSDFKEENKRLKEALHKIADCDCPLVENESGYTTELPECRRIAEAALKNGG